MNSPIKAVVMAGGLGSRLRPLTNSIPKPMLPVGDRPLLQRIVEQLRGAGFCDISISTCYRAEEIMNFFGDGSRFGVELTYIEEKEPLGTAGALGLVEVEDKPLLILNGDILTRIDYMSMLTHHLDHDADLTMAVHTHKIQVPYGVVESDGLRVSGMTEKPTMEYSINAGMYVMSPAMHARIPRGKMINMSQLIDQLLADDCRVIQYPFVDYWLDIGQKADYEKAQFDIVLYDAASSQPTQQKNRAGSIGRADAIKRFASCAV